MNPPPPTSKLVGPDCRTLLEVYDEVLGKISDSMLEKEYGDAEARDFVSRHSAVLKPLKVVSRLTRKVTDGLLPQEEQTALKAACAEFGNAWRASYPDRILTPKGHVVEAHVPDFVDWFGVCGVLGEDGAEALHVIDNLCRKLVRQMPNPEMRHKAATLHLACRVTCEEIRREVKKRPSKKRRLEATAPAAGGGGGGGM